MEIKVFDILPSTQKYLINEIKNHNINDEICIIAINQNKGIGSRKNTWNIRILEYLVFFCKK